MGDVKVGSLFSGAGGFDMGLERAGMEVVWQVEFDKQCRSVLRRHWPDTDLQNDVNCVGGEWHGYGPGRATLAPVDLIAFGSPCQGLSVAGKREGLADDRSGLFIEAVRIIDELAPRWVVFENVPGLLSSERGEDFAVCLEGFTGWRPQVPDDGWRNSGFAVGPRYGVSWRVCDSQFWGVAQRRRRVFIVGYLGGPCPPEVLFEPEGLPWHPPPSREKGARVAGNSEAGVGIEGGVGHRMTAFGEYVEDQTASTLKQRDYKDATDLVVNALSANGVGTCGADDNQAQGNHLIAHTLRAEGFDTSEDGTGRGTPIVADTLVSGGRETQPHGALDGKNIIAGTLRVGGRDHGAGDGPDNTPIVLPTNRGKNRRVLDGHQRRIGGENRIYDDSGATPTLQGTPPGVVAFNATQDPISGAISAEGAAALTSVPRRLTPRETERLQYWPDDWTRYGIKDDGTEVEMADGPRYRMCGNGITASVSEWIGRRIMNLDSQA